MSSDLDKLAASFGDADATVDLSNTIAEAWLALLFFWALGLTVLYQFITRYVFTDSAAWTEEIARYLLIATVFVGDREMGSGEGRSKKVAEQLAAEIACDTLHREHDSN